MGRALRGDVMSMEELKALYDAMVAAVTAGDNEVAHAHEDLIRTEALRLIADDQGDPIEVARFALSTSKGGVREVVRMSTETLAKRSAKAWIAKGRPGTKLATSRPAPKWTEQERLLAQRAEVTS